MASSQKKAGRRTSSPSIPTCAQCKTNIALDEVQVKCVLCEKIYHLMTCSMLSSNAKRAFKTCGPELQFLCTPCQIRLPELRKSANAHPPQPANQPPTPASPGKPPVPSPPSAHADTQSVAVDTQSTGTDTQCDPPAYQGRVVTFSGSHDPLSNHFPAQITYSGKTFPSVEHAYLHWKAFRLGAPRELVNDITHAPTAAKAKFLSRSIPTDDIDALADWNGCCG